jgi:hypothetical protein
MAEWAYAQSDEAAHRMRKMLLAVFYWSCFVLIVGSLAAMCLLCVSIARDSAVAANELNAASRRMYVQQRLSYLADELVYTNDPKGSLTAGKLTYLNSTEIIRCTLRSAAFSLLSSHYALLYGSNNGWANLPRAQGWAPVSSWLGSGWSIFRDDGRPLPDETQQPGMEVPPAWIGKGDYCSPFTLGMADFEATKETPGSIGRTKEQDDIYFTPNCFTDLSLRSNAPVLTIPRLRRFLEEFDSAACYGFRNDLVLCSAKGPRAADLAYPLRADLEAALTALNADRAVDFCDRETFGCQQAKNRRLCETHKYTETDMRYQTNDMCSLTQGIPTGTGTAKPVSLALLNPALSISRRQYVATNLNSRKVEVGAFKVHDLQNGIANLDFYAANFRSEPMYGMVKPADAQMRQGLHNLVTFITDHAIALAQEPAANIAESNKHYQVIYKYSRLSLDSGKELSMGLTKSMVTYLDEALGNQQQSSSTILAAYIVVLIVLLLQYVLLGHRVEHLIARHMGVLSVIQRLMQAAEAAAVDETVVDADKASNDADDATRADDDDLGSVRSCEDAESSSSNASLK